MHRQAAPSGQGRRLKARSGASIVRFLWMLGYLTVGLGALFSTFFYPDLVSILRSQRDTIQPELHVVAQRGDQPRTGELRLKQEVVPLYLTQLRSSNLTQLPSPNLSQLPSPNLTQLPSLDLELKSFTSPPFDRQFEARREFLAIGRKRIITKESLELKKRWKPPPNRGYHPCVEPSQSYSGPAKPRGFLVVQSNGGLNQMRAGICDMVAVARILNATLVVPELDKRSFWQDSSNFSDIFDVDHFIEALKGDVHVVKSLPQEYLKAPKAVKQFQSWSNVKYYEDTIAPVWRDYKVIRAAKSDSRLANNDLPADIQKLRCRVHYDALRFSHAIDEFGKMLVERMRKNGPYIALHLRYEKDMLAFSGCTYGLTEKEADELTNIRKHTAHWRVKDINSTDQRVRGFCPLTPTEVGIFLKALGYPKTTPIYIAAGEIYGGDKRMAGLLSRFPIVMRKETVATPEELAPFVNHSSQLAALDYIVSVESDVFVPSYSGNMARAVEGHRRYLGHRKTITPDRKELVALSDKLDTGVLAEGPELAELITNIHRRRQGAPRKRKGPISGTKGRDRFRTEEAFYTNPLPDCLCSETDPIKSGAKKSQTDRQLLSCDGLQSTGSVSSWQRH